MNKKLLTERCFPSPLGLDSDVAKRVSSVFAGFFQPTHHPFSVWYNSLVSAHVLLQSSLPDAQVLPSFPHINFRSKSEDLWIM
jgi:hypothetical protein